MGRTLVQFKQDGWLTGLHARDRLRSGLGLRPPFLLLTFTMLMWGGNAVASRLAVGEVSPLTFTFLRWTSPVTILASVAQRRWFRY
jgi:drug/metabolite transporter (DMT)-like permease